MNLTPPVIRTARMNNGLFVTTEIGPGFLVGLIGLTYTSVY